MTRAPRDCSSGLCVAASEARATVGPYRLSIREGVTPKENFSPAKRPSGEAPETRPIAM